MKAQEQLSHDGDQGDHLLFVTLFDEVLVSGLEGRFSAYGDQGGHIEGRTDVAIAGLGDIAMTIEAGAGLAHARVEAGVCDPLGAFHLGIQNEQFAQKQDGAFVSDAPHGAQQLKFTLERGISLDNLTSGGDERFDAFFDQGDRATQVLSHDLTGRAVGLDGMQAVVFTHALSAKLVQAPGDALQREGRGGRSHPDPERHDLEETQDARRVDLVGFASKAFCPEEVFDGFGIDDGDLKAWGATEQKSHFQTVGAGGFQADPHGGAVRGTAPGMGDEFFVTNRIIGNGQSLDAICGQPGRGDQFQAADIDAKQMRICFHGDQFLCSLPLGSPTLNPCPPTLLLRLPERSGPCALSGVWQRGRGAFLTHKVK